MYKKSNLVYADFMKSDYEDRLQLVCFGTIKDLEKYNITLKEGMNLVFYNEDEDNEGNRDDLVVEGKVEYDEENKRWTARINWDDIKNISQLSTQEKLNLGIK